MSHSGTLIPVGNWRQASPHLGTDSQLCAHHIRRSRYGICGPHMAGRTIGEEARQTSLWRTKIGPLVVRSEVQSGKEVVGKAARGRDRPVCATGPETMIGKIWVARIRHEAIGFEQSAQVLIFRVRCASGLRTRMRKTIAKFDEDISVAIGSRTLCVFAQPGTRAGDVIFFSIERRSTESFPLQRLHSRWRLSGVRASR